MAGLPAERVIHAVAGQRKLPWRCVDLLRTNGHDVAWIRTDSPGASDPQVLARAVAENGVLLTFDKDFGELVFRARSDASCGVILFRFSPPSSAALAQKVLHALQQRSDWSGRFSTIDERGIRTAALPR